MNRRYDQDYREAMAALEAALHKRDAVEREIASLGKRIEALEVLMDHTPLGDGTDRPWWRQGGMQEQAGTALTRHIAKTTITERVRHLLSVVDVPITSGEIHEKLRHLGVELQEKANPWALIHGICRRLVDQGFAREVDKDGRKAWVVVKKP